MTLFNCVISSAYILQERDPWIATNVDVFIMALAVSVATLWLVWCAAVVAFSVSKIFPPRILVLLFLAMLNLTCIATTARKVLPQIVLQTDPNWYVEYDNVEQSPVEDQ